MLARRIGKSQARAQFLQLVQSVAVTGDMIEITDRGRAAAVLLSHAEYLRLLARAHQEPRPRMSPVGTMELLEELEEGDTTRLLLGPLQQRADDL